MSAMPMSEGMRPAAGDLDLRALPSIEPMLRALAATDTLQPGATLVLWTPMLPLPILQMLAARDLESSMQMFADGTARVTVRCPRVKARRGRR
jgi:hypothetical protein